MDGRAGLRKPVCDLVDGEGWPRADDWRAWTRKPAAGARSCAPQRPDAGVRFGGVRSAPRQGGARRAIWRKLTSSSLFQARRRNFTAVCRTADDAASRCQWRHCQLCGHAQHQLHQHLLLQMPASAPFQKASSARICAAALMISNSSAITPRMRGLGAGRDGSLHAGRHSPVLYRAHLPGHLQGGQGERPRNPCARIFAAGGVPGRENAWPVALGLPRAS